MTTLTDIPPFPADGYAPLADQIAQILHTQNDVLLIQAEAVVALEACAMSLGRPGASALNIVTSMYGQWFGGWLRRAGADVVDLQAAAGQPIALAAVADALAQGDFDLVALVHAESAYGILNPLPDIAALARAHGALVVVDAVASVGGHALRVDEWGIDLAVIGPQKSLGGQAGTSAIAVSDRAWAAVAPQGEAPSILSLADQRALWLDRGRGALPGTPSAIEFHALHAALARVADEGAAALIARHADTADRARRAALLLTGRAWVRPDAASNLVTAVALPDGISAADVLALAPKDTALSAGVGPAGDRIIRLNHTGPRATPWVIEHDISVLCDVFLKIGLPVDRAAVLEALR
ncbi:pyridoxal-phosphate-dependent aminotransferase family protein [Ketogulonicigenium vulgare]|uniref:Aspartate aminotransferase protein n=1 Tax=Ketogulonicigenium vulgare (strain WSH-001) TaxID=759362 RepID=F9Y5Z5_KETVW|nr:aminotransferase class V-fold PLP-dependent enzyme [Ketogulonicigenium vulgare]AEM40820.1 aspartate aminotransferase protein [Ketogulonicigenium vulgare WSH-001]ALJ80985.1 aspartate aminotransferase [Ketogulonicigenium vulgare]ANW33750.1 aspartate aminotransferase [Ketogulonicigenium vulgare]AOZ54538.1 aspartate aminotransferase protein [Ketogulonicigenium vulgare]